jgi:hypothetical protein
MARKSEAQSRADKKYRAKNRAKINEAERYRFWKKHVCKDPFKQAWKELLIMDL